MKSCSPQFPLRPPDSLVDKFLILNSRKKGLIRFVYKLIFAASPKIRIRHTFIPKCLTLTRKIFGAIGTYKTTAKKKSAVFVHCSKHKGNTYTTQYNSKSVTLL